jgi:hypothetical protein
MTKKAHPIDVKIEIANKKDWKKTNNLTIKVSGLFRNSGWRVENVGHKIIDDVIQIEINSKHLGGMSLMVLSPFEISEEISIEKPKDSYKVRVVFDGEESATEFL